MIASTPPTPHTNHGEVSTGHFREDGVEVGLVFSVDEPVVEHSLALVTKQPEDLLLVPNHTRVCLKNTYTHRIVGPHSQSYLTSPS